MRPRAARGSEERDDAFALRMCTQGAMAKEGETLCC